VIELPSAVIGNLPQLQVNYKILKLFFIWILTGQFIEMVFVPTIFKCSGTDITLTIILEIIVIAGEV